MMDKLMREIGELCDVEFARANKQHPAFASDHEGHDVLKEEIDETGDAFDKVCEAECAMNQAIRKNDEAEVRKIAMELYDRALETAAEAVQVAAMAQKIVKSQDLRRSRGWIPPCHLV